MENEAITMDRLYEELKLLREQNSRMEALKTENERLKEMLTKPAGPTPRETVSPAQPTEEEFSESVQLRKINTRYRSIFNTVPVSIAEMDFSIVKVMLDNLSKSGVSDLALYFQENPGFLKQCARDIKIVDVNDETLKIYGATSKEQLLVPLDNLLTDESYGVLADGLLAISGGSAYFEAESENRTLNGEVINILLKISLPSEDNLYDRVVVCIVDVTIRKRMVNGFIQHRLHLENLVDKRTGEMERLLEELTKENNFRRQMEVELKQSEETLKTLLDAIQESAFLLDTDYRIVQCNKTGAGRLGLTPEDLIGNVIDSVLPYEITTGNKTRLKNVFTTGRPFKYKEIRDGKVYDATCHPIIDWKKDVYMVALFLQDITDREMTYYALRESEDRFRKIFEEGPLGMALVGLDLHPVKVNGMLCRMLGHSEDALKSMFITDFIHPDDVGKCLQLSKELYMGHIPYCKGENRFIKKDGATTWGNLTLSILPNKIGEPQYFLAMIEDISKRKTSEEHLRHSEKTLKALIDSVEESVLLLDTDLNVIKCNGTFAGKLNIFENTMININLYNLMPSAFTTFVKDQVERLVRTKKKIQFETDYKDSFFEVTCYPLMDEDGDLSKFTVFARDVTDRKKLEEHLRMYQKLDFIGKLAGGIAHDINNSITAISSAVYFLRKYLSHDDPLLKYVDNIHNAAERATIIAKGLLTFSRKQVIHPKPIDCSYVVNNISNLIDRLIGEDVTVETLAEKRGLMIMADANQIELCIMNLAFNARDAMPEGGTLTIKTG
ncbi:MAG: PAS domain S-box protein, partial [Nitrospirae bacterium]|nr:PAS domain S-box protein [Nitrospirota bacterium]